MMLTVIVGFERSGKNRTRSALPGSRYSVMPSTDVTFSTCAYAEDTETSRQRSSCSGAVNLRLRAIALALRDFLRVRAIALALRGAPAVHQLRHRRRL